MIKFLPILFFSIMVSLGWSQTTDVISQIDTPYRMILNGNDLYISSLNVNGTIRKMDITSQIPANYTTYPMTVSYAAGIALKGNDLYICNNTKVVKIDVTQSSPTPVDVVTGLQAAMELILNGDDLYIAEHGNGRISKINTTDALPATPTTVLTGLGWPAGFAIKNNELYISDLQQNRVVKIDMTASLPTTLTDVATGITSPDGLAILGDELYISLRDMSKVVKLDTNNPLPTTTSDVLNVGNPQGLLIYNDDLYVARQGASKIVKSTNLTLGTSFSQEYITEFNFFPNPAEDIVTINGTAPNASVKIYTVDGRHISSTTLSNHNNIDVSELARGCYFLKIEDGKTIKLSKR